MFIPPFWACNICARRASAKASASAWVILGARASVSTSIRSRSVQVARISARLRSRSVR